MATGAPNTYTPPARRPPSGQPTVKGAPVDPAIISSQLARPDSTAAKAAQRTASPSTEKGPPATDSAKTEVVAKAAAPVPEASNKTKTPAPVKPSDEQAQKPSAALKPSAGIPARKPGRPDNATANVEHDLLDSFKQFSAAEKLRISEKQRSLARESKAVKLNDLKKFSQNFKLHTPVPTDLVPILAKDEGKQQLIVEKALRTVQELKTTPPKPAPATADVKAVPRPNNVKPDAQPSPSPAVDRQQNQRQRPGQNQYGSSSVRDRAHMQNVNQPPRGNHGLLSSRLQLNQQQHKQQGGIPPYHGVPQPIPHQDMRNAPPTGPSVSPSTSGVQTPMSTASRNLNVKAHEFKPNPAANTFQPGPTPSNHSSPRPESVSRQEPPRKVQITSFFGAGSPPAKKPLDLSESFNPIARLTKDAAQDPQKARQYQNNGGIQPTYHTPPTWDFPETNKEKGYVDMFERPATAPVPTPHNMMGNGHTPHQHHVPPQFQGPQGGPQGQTPHHTPRHPPVQPHHGQGPHHFDSQHMQFSHSNSSVHPSPRAVPGPYMYGSQPQSMPGYPQQVPMQAFGLSPNIQHAGLRGAQGGPQFVSPPGPAMGGQMMTNQPSNGPYMGMPGNTQMPMYGGAPPHGYPQYPGQMPTGPGPNGFGSPRPGGAPLMSHQGSQQGHQQPHMMYMQPGGQGPPMFAQAPPGASKLIS